jgi:hypothetical protein
MLYREKRILNKRNKENCKSAPLKIKIKFWFIRNEEILWTIFVSTITSLIVQLAIKYLI